MGGVIDENLHNVLMKSRDIKGTLFKTLYLPNYISNSVEILHVHITTKPIGLD